MTIAEIFPETKVPAEAEPPKVRYTTVTSDRPLSKRFADLDGRPSKLASDATLVSGMADRFLLKGDAHSMAKAFAADLEHLTVNQAIICAPPPSGQKSWRLVTEAMLKNNPGAIARTKENFAPPAGPALFTFDIDRKDFPPNIKKRLPDDSALFAALASACPELPQAAAVWRRSMSCGVKHKTTGHETPRDAGLHVFHFIREGRDASRFAKAVRDRLVLAGYGWGHVTAAGHVLIKTLIDLNASSDTSRLSYEGQAILESDALEFVPDARKPMVRAGGFLDTSRLPDLTDDERAELRNVEDEIRARHADEAELARLAHKQRTRATAKLDPLRHSDFEADHRSALDDYTLQGDFPIHLDDGRWVTARQIAANPHKFDELTCSDPLEPDYHGGRNIGIIYTGGGDVRIESQAHGGATYPIRLKVADFWVEPDKDDGTTTDQPSGRVITPTPFVWRDPKTIKPREWLYGGHYLRKFLSATIAPGGLGKSSLNLAENIAMATQRPLLGVQPNGRFRTWVWNGEDPFEEVERRVHAVMLYYGVDRSELEDWLYFDSGRATPLTVALQTKDGAVIHAPDVKAIKEGARARKIDVLTIDPFISSHRVTENDNDAMALVARTYAQIADELNISIELVHHARKLNGREATAEDSRGAAALVDAARAVRTLTRPTDKEMREFGLAGDVRTYFRFGQLGKDNLTAPASKNTQWMALKNQDLGNGTPQYPDGDKIGVVTAHTPVMVTELAGSDQTAEILHALASGEYLDSAISRDRWAGSVVAGVLGLEPADPDDKIQIVGVIKSLKAAGRIRAVHRYDPTCRKSRQFIQVTET